MGVVVSPDYVFFRDKFCLGYLVVFSCTGIKIKDSNACGVQESFAFEKGIDDIVDIKFQWLQRVSFTHFECLLFVAFTCLLLKIYIFFSGLDVVWIS